MAMGNYHHRPYFFITISLCQSLRCGLFFLNLLPPCQLILLLVGESEYWLSMIKVIMIILFIIVGLIYDWGGIEGHPGPVGPFIV